MPVILILAVLAVLLLSRSSSSGAAPPIGSPAGGSTMGSQPRFAGGSDYYSAATGSKCIANTATGTYDCSQYDPCAPPPSGLNSTNQQLSHILAVANRVCPGNVSQPLPVYGAPPPPPPPHTAAPPPAPAPATPYAGFYSSVQTVASPNETLRGPGHFN